MVGGLGSCYRKEGEVHPAFSAAKSPPGHLFYGPWSTRQTVRKRLCKNVLTASRLCFLKSTTGGTTSFLGARRTSHNQDNHPDVTQHPGIQRDLMISFSCSPIWLLPMFPPRKHHHNLVVLAGNGEMVALQPIQSSHPVNTQVPLHSHLMLMSTIQDL